MSHCVGVDDHGHVCGLGHDNACSHVCDDDDGIHDALAGDNSDEDENFSL